MIDDFCLHRVKDEVHVGVEQLLTQNSMWHSNLCFLLYSATLDAYFHQCLFGRTVVDAMAGGTLGGGLSGGLGLLIHTLRVC